MGRESVIILSPKIIWFRNTTVDSCVTERFYTVSCSPCNVAMIYCAWGEVKIKHKKQFQNKKLIYISYSHSRFVQNQSCSCNSNPKCWFRHVLWCFPDHEYCLVSASGNWRHPSSSGVTCLIHKTYQSMLLSICSSPGGHVFKSGSLNENYYRKTSLAEEANSELLHS